MRIRFRKISDERHALEIDREDGRREAVECETRSYLLHDLLHYAVETEAKLDGGLEFVLAVQKRMRELQGAWKATPFGGVMELGWPRR